MYKNKTPKMTVIVLVTPKQFLKYEIYIYFFIKYTYVHK